MASHWQVVSFFVQLAALTSGEHCSRDSGDECTDLNKEMRDRGNILLQVSSPRGKGATGEVARHQKNAEGIEWKLDEKGNYKASAPLEPELVFTQKPDSNVGCSTCDCSFIARDGFASPCDIEMNSRISIAKWLPENSSVLEVGARYGSVSCAISAKQKHSGKAVCMDADENVWESLEKNRVGHGCQFQVARGLLGKVDGKIRHDHFGTSAQPVDAIADGVAGFNESVTVPHFTIEDLQKKFNIHFDVAAFDCEGCFANAMTDFPDFVNQLSMMIVECHDAGETAAVERLLANGWKMEASFSRQRILTRIASPSNENGAPPSIEDTSIEDGVKTSIEDNTAS